MGEPSQPMMMQTIQPSSHSQQRGQQPYKQQQPNRNMAAYQMLSPQM